MARGAYAGGTHAAQTQQQQKQQETVMPNFARHLVWLAIAIVGALSLATVALGRGEAVSALWVWWPRCACT